MGDVHYCIYKWVFELPSDKGRWSNVDLMLIHRPRRRPNIIPTLSQRLVLAELYLMNKSQDMEKWE